MTGQGKRHAERAKARAKGLRKARQEQIEAAQEGTLHKIKESIRKNSLLAGKVGVSAVSAGGTVLLYVQGTATAPNAIIRTNSITINAVFGLLAAGESFDHIVDRIKSFKDKKDRYAILKLIIALIVSGGVALAPTVVTALLTEAIEEKFIFAILTELATTQSNLFSIMGLLNIPADLKDFFNRFQKAHDKKTQTLRRLEECLAAIQHGDIHNIAEALPTEGTLEKKFEELSNLRPKNMTSTSFWESSLGHGLSSVGRSLRGLAGMLTSILMVYGCSGYTCITAAGFSESFGFGPLLSMLLANIPVGALYLLNIKAAMWLTGAIFESIFRTCAHRSLDNSLKVGGILGKLGTALALALAGYFSWGSGFSSRRFFEEGCLSATSEYPYALRFPFGINGADIVEKTTMLFNGIFFYLTLAGIKLGLLKLSGSPQDKNYLELVGTLQKLIADLKKMPVKYFEQDSRANAQAVDNAAGVGNASSSSDETAPLLENDTEKAPANTEAQQEAADKAMVQMTLKFLDGFLLMPTPLAHNLQGPDIQVQATAPQPT